MFAVILLFSLCGYRMVIDLLQSQADHAMISVINEEAYGEDNLVSLKVPVSLPYYTNSEQFQHISGDITIEGALYRYVKRRIYRDSIEYLCLRDVTSTSLQSARDQFFQLAYDMQAFKTGKTKQPSPVKPLMLEYCSETLVAEIIIFESGNTPLVFKKQAFTPQPYQAQPSQPPEQVNNFIYC